MEYYPNVFIQPDLTGARRIILTPEQGLTTDQRWEAETEWLLPHLHALPKGLMLDYGCGIGRLSKIMHDHSPVLGVDLSLTMRIHAEGYVERLGFGCVNPHFFSSLIQEGLQVHSAIAVWVLQHAMHPEFDISLIYQAMRPGGTLLTVNRDDRVVPAQDGDWVGWVNDGKDINQLLAARFTLFHEEPMPAELCAPGAFLRKWRMP